MAFPDRRIMIFIDWYAPGFRAGGPTRSIVNLVDALRNDYQFFIVTTNTDYMHDEPYDLPQGEWVERGINEKVYYWSGDGDVASLWKALEHSVDPHIVYVNSMFSRCFAITPLKVLKHKPRIIAPRGMLASSALGQKRLKKQLFLRYAKLSDLFANVTWHSTGEKESEDILRVFSKATIVQAPNVVSVPASREKEISKRQDELRLISVARIALEKNTLYAVDILSRMNKPASLHLIGAIYDQAYWKECLRRIEQLPDHIQVAHKGEVAPAELSEMMQTYHAMFLPTKGENFGHAIYEALVNGLPVLTSDQTPWNFSPEASGSHSLPLSDPNGFVSVLDDWSAQDEASFRSLSEKAYSFATEYFQEQQYQSHYRKLFG